MSILETQNLTHIFPDGTIAIEDISLKINEGEFVIIAGSNGSGKTVFIRHLNGLLRPSKGKVLIEDETTTKNTINIRKKVGMIFQDSDSQIVGQTVSEDTAFGPENLNLPRKEVNKLVNESLEAVGLEQCINQNPYALSGGQKRKLAIAGILAMTPKIIVLDEPFTGLDYPGVIQIIEQIIKLHKKGHTIILVTHELEKVLAHADRLVIIYKGKLVQNGSPSDIIHQVEQYGVRMPLKENEGVEVLTWLK